MIVNEFKPHPVLNVHGTESRVRAFVIQYPSEEAMTHRRRQHHSPAYRHDKTRYGVFVCVA